MDTDEKPEQGHDDEFFELETGDAYRLQADLGLSVAYAMADPESQARIREAHEVRVRKALDDLEGITEQRERMTELVRGFPCLVNAWGIDPFDPVKLNRWSATGVSHGERITASFLLAIRDPSTDWDCGRFDLMEALRAWPPSHREAFLRWASDPWWP